ncbi:hypothetical protein [Bradyrhizobium canariense]|uniref:Uncharacterized protein n=1 Tax=Bradyrhizobium canariense TaxID=255045 RepID=A0A1X3GK84_9BRAD|nr:hypothetical protein [Bradyrhizobium canariense]OSI68874.1 hypothetical protein BSZ22_19810 [Bradyrhizobium canariense]OSI79413.1 hypothetical protein BSZ23_15125 [Bradyrhizobium canariense]OSI89589.1 hypothetical protein BSZ25_20275 [Bradyrhizobium canariense]OSI91033.1 hypothetical protein BSZ24_18930 [Bradyrhizobium canariense]OSJ03955.1 hypothetical protein BSZ16_14710 [Bradyrhizobium canariense]
MSGYPDSPGYKSVGPSSDAARAIAGTAKTLRAKVLRTIAAAPAGLSADAVAELLKESILSVRPRVSELHRSGEIKKTDGRAKNASGLSATVWVASPPLPGPSAAEIER